MKAYILSLQREVEAQQAAKAERERQAATPVKPLDQQIIELMNSLPPVQRDRPWPISEVVEKLEGKYRQRPHAQGVGQVLRRLGWKRIRPSGNGGDRRVWLPPNEITCRQ